MVKKLVVNVPFFEVNIDDMGETILYVIHDDHRKEVEEFLKERMTSDAWLEKKYGSIQ